MSSSARYSVIEPDRNYRSGIAADHRRDPEYSAFESAYHGKWPDHERDMSFISVTHPDVLMCLECFDLEFDTAWRKWFIGGKRIRVDRLTWPDKPVV